MDSRKRKPQYELTQPRVKVSNKKLGQMDAAMDEDWEGVSDSAGEESNPPSEEALSQNESEEEEEQDEEEDKSNMSFAAKKRAMERARRAQPKSSRPKKTEGRNDKRNSKASETRSPASRTVPPPAAKKRKDAPEEMSSKVPISRFKKHRPAASRQDPPAVPWHRPPQTDDEYRRFRRDYAFLDEYRDSEMQKLREIAAARKGVAPEDREDAKLRLQRMQNEKRAQDRRDREVEQRLERKREEKELVKQGKKPFFLKGSEERKMQLLDRFAGMTKGQVDKAIENKRKKVAGKEKKKLPYARRGAE